MAMLSIRITLAGDAADVLRENGFRFHAFQANDTNIAAWPTLWYATAKLSPLMRLEFPAAGDAYTAVQTGVAPPSIVRPGAVYPLADGQTLQITGAGGTGSVVNQGTPGLLTIANRTASQFTAGPARTANGEPPIPTCAFQLFGGNDALIRPRDAVLLAIESASRQPGEAVRTLTAPSLLVSLDDSATRSIAFALNTNWAANTQRWATGYPAATDLRDVLIAPVLAPRVDDML